MPPNPAEIHALLLQLQINPEEARSALLELTCERLRRLASTMLKKFPRLARWSDTDEVMQAATLRLYRALNSVQPETPEKFFGLAATQIRRELIDLIRHFYGPEGMGTNHHSDSGKILNGAVTRVDHANFDEWELFHAHVENLPDPLRKVVEQVWYVGLKQADAADILGISLPTLKRRWVQARLMLADALKEKHDRE